MNRAERRALKHGRKFVRGYSMKPGKKRFTTHTEKRINGATVIQVKEAGK